jgi:hypothetical protein
MLPAVSVRVTVDPILHSPVSWRLDSDLELDPEPSKNRYAPYGFAYSRVVQIRSRGFVKLSYSLSEERP